MQIAKLPQEVTGSSVTHHFHGFMLWELPVEIVTRLAEGEILFVSLGPILSSAFERSSL